jgi:glycosyltransferase involved in cell wall biosynthesis
MRDADVGRTSTTIAGTIARRRQGPTQPEIVLMTTIPESLAFYRGLPTFLRRRGFVVHAVASPAPALERFAADEGTSACSVAMSRRITPAHDLVAVSRLWRLFRRLRPAIVHAGTPKAGLLGMIAARAAGVPVRVYGVLGLPHETAHGLRRLLLHASEWVACRAATEVICIGPSVRDRLVADGLCPRDKARVLGSGSTGVDAAGRFNPAGFGPEVRRATRAAWSIPDDAPVIGFVGRLTRDKGIPDLVEAWRSLRDCHPDAHLLVVGPFDPTDPVPDDVAEKLGTDDRIHLAGLVADPRPFYAAMDLLVLPTYREGFGNVLIEAGAMELPVVATRVTGCVDAVQEGVTGLLVAPRQPAELASAIRVLLRDPDLRRRFGLAGRERALREFSPEVIRQALYETYVRQLRARGLAEAAGE